MPLLPGSAGAVAVNAIQHFFEHYKDLEPNKWVKVVGWDGPDAARKEISDGMAAWAKT